MSERSAASRCIMERSHCIVRKKIETKSNKGRFEEKKNSKEGNIECSLVPYELGRVCGVCRAAHLCPSPGHPSVHSSTSVVSQLKVSKFETDSQDRQTRAVPVCLTSRVTGVRSCVSPPSSSRGLSCSSLLPLSLVDHFIHSGLLVSRACNNVLVIG